MKNLTPDTIYRRILDEPLSEDENRALRRWLRSSFYNRALIEDIEKDERLKSQLLEAYSKDKTAFWKIIITYRTALHDGMPDRRGNFWQRMLSIGKLFRRNGNI